MRARVSRVPARVDLEAIEGLRAAAVFGMVCAAGMLALAFGLETDLMERSTGPPGRLR